jgi:hypothetical protein
MTDDVKPFCSACRSPLAFLHGHYACLLSWCPLYGVNVVPCCQP